MPIISPPWPEWALTTAREALARGPVATERWTSGNPPTDVVGPPAVYQIDSRGRRVEIDRWLVALVEADGGAERAVEFIASELACRR